MEQTRQHDGEEKPSDSARPTLTRERVHHDQESSNNDNDNDSSTSSSMAHEKSTRHIVDDHEARDDEKHNIFTRLVSSLRAKRNFLLASVLIVVAWSCFCVLAAERLADEAANYPAGRADKWLDWLEGAGSKFRMIGILFSFAVVFRFNRCYDRWNTGRIIWGKIISTSLDATRMASYWMLDDNYADSFCRFVVVFGYACKALLRGNSLGHADEEGRALVERGFLTQEEFDDIEDNLGWQPWYCLDMLGAILVEAHYPQKVMMFDSNHKVHSQLFRAIDGAISNLSGSLGEAV